MKIEGCAAVITGGASGLGEACVRDLVKFGANVGILDLQVGLGEKIASELGRKVRFLKTDVTDQESVENAIDRTMDAFGGIQIAINCAGIGLPAKVLGKEGPMHFEKFTKVLMVNLVGTMNVIRLVSEKMIRNSPNEDGEKGVIINTASTAAFEGQVGQAAYSASKAGIVGMTLPIAREFADYGIRVVTIAPGLFDTPILSEKAKESLGSIIPFPRRLGKPVEFSSLVNHVIGNPMLNGTTIRLDAALRMPAR